MNWGTRWASAWDYNALDRVCWSDDQFLCQKEDEWLLSWILRRMLFSQASAGAPHTVRPVVWPKLPNWEKPGRKLLSKSSWTWKGICEIGTAWDGGKGGTILSDLRSNNSQTWVFASLLSGLDASVWSDAKLEVKGTGSFINPLFSCWLFDSLGKNFCWGCLFTIGLVLVRSGLGRSCRAGAGLWKKSFSFLIKSCLI